MPDERAPDLGLFLDILFTLDKAHVDAQARSLGAEAEALWQDIKAAAHEQAQRER